MAAVIDLRETKHGVGLRGRGRCGNLGSRQLGPTCRTGKCRYSYSSLRRGSLTGNREKLQVAMSSLNGCVLGLLPQSTAALLSTYSTKHINDGIGRDECEAR